MRRCGKCATCLVDKKRREPCLELQRQRQERWNGIADPDEDRPRLGEEPQEGRRAAGMPRTASGKLAFQADKSLMLFTSDYDSRARSQHLANLVFLLRHSVATSDWRRVAQLAAILLASDRPDNLSEKWMFRHPDSRARVAEALEAGWLLLQQQWGTLSYEQTRRYLQQWATFQIATAGKEAVLLQLARYCREQGHATDAWDFLTTQQFTTAAVEAQRHAMMGGIRAEAWMQAMRGAAEQMAVVQHPAGSPNKRRRGGPQRAAAWEPWQHNAQVAARAGRMARELHEQAVESCKKSLELQPEATQLAHQLAQLHLAAGDANSALATARRQHKQAAADADAAGLLALLLVAQPAQHSTAQQLSQQQASQGLEEGGQQQPGPLSPEAAIEAAGCLVQLLAADPSSHTAAAALLALHAQHPLPPALLIEGCCYYLEGQPPSWLPPLLELRAWQHLAATLVQSAALVADHQQRFSDLLQRRQALLPRSLHEAHLQLQRRQQGEGSSREQQRWAELQELTEAAVEEQGQLRLALQAYEQCCTLMRGRLWWRDAHLLPQPADTVAEALQTASADPAVVLALAAVNAFLHPLWQRQAVEQWRASRGATPLPRMLENMLTRHSAAALRTAGYEQEAAALRAALKLCRKAASAAASAAEASSGIGPAAAALASIARQRADFWRAARRPWKPPAGWVPIPLGARHPQLGRINPLPQQWWACFPQYRRRQRKAPPGNEPVAAAAGAAAGAAEVEPWAATVAAAAAAVMAAAGTSPGPTPASQATAQRTSGGRQQPQALRRLQAQQPPGVRSILKGSQEQAADGEWAGASQLQQPQVPGSGRAARRVQFQLPHSPTAAAAGERGSQQQRQQQQQADDMDVDAAGSQEPPQHGAAAAAAAAAAVGDGNHGPAKKQKHGKGRRRLLPQQPAALAEDDGDGGSGMGAGAGAWRAKLQRRRSSLQQQQQQPHGSGW